MRLLLYYGIILLSARCYDLKIIIVIIISLHIIHMNRCVKKFPAAVYKLSGKVLCFIYHVYI